MTIIRVTARTLAMDTMLMPAPFPTSLANVEYLSGHDIFVHEGPVPSPEIKFKLEIN